MAQVHVAGSPPRALAAAPASQGADVVCVESVLLECGSPTCPESVPLDVPRIWRHNPSGFLGTDSDSGSDSDAGLDRLRMGVRGGRASGAMPVPGMRNDESRRSR